MLAHGFEKQRHLFGDCGSSAACTARALAAYVFAVAFADAEPLPRAGALGHTAEGDCSLFFAGWREPSSCGLWLSRRVIVRATRFFNGRSPSEAPKRRPAHRHRIWTSHRRAVSDPAF